MGISSEADTSSADTSPGQGQGQGKGPSPPPPAVDLTKRCKKIRDDINQKFPREIEETKDKIKPRMPVPIGKWRPEQKFRELDVTRTLSRAGAMIPGKTTVRTIYKEIEPVKPSAMQRGNIGILIDSSGSMGSGGSSPDGYVTDKWDMSMKAAMGFVNMAELLRDTVTIVTYSGEGTPIFRRCVDYNLMHNTLCNMTHTPHGGTCIYCMGIQYLWLDAKFMKSSTNIIITDANLSSRRPRYVFKKPVGTPKGDGTYHDDIDVETHSEPYPIPFTNELFEGEYFIREMLQWGPVIVFQMSHGVDHNIANRACEAGMKEMGNHPNFIILPTWADNWEEFSREISPVIERASERWLKSRGR